MNNHPLGDPTALSVVPELPSIVDQILDLDEIEAVNVRRAEKTARICIRPDLEADIDVLKAELGDLVDENGRPIDEIDPSLGSDGGRTAAVVSAEIRAKQIEMAQAMRSIRMRALDSDAWQAFKARHKAAFESDDYIRHGLLTRPAYEELVILCAFAPSFDAEAIQKAKANLGIAQVDELFSVAFQVNTMSGVSVPKSQTSLAVLRRQRPSSN